MSPWEDAGTQYDNSFDGRLTEGTLVNTWMDKIVTANDLP